MGWPKDVNELLILRTEWNTEGHWRPRFYFIQSIDDAFRDETTDPVRLGAIPKRQVSLTQQCTDALHGTKPHILAHSVRYVDLKPLGGLRPHPAPEVQQRELSETVGDTLLHMTHHPVDNLQLPETRPWPYPER